MYRIFLSTLRMKTCAPLNGAAESTVPDTLAAPAIPELCAGGAAAQMVTPKKMHAAPKLAISLLIRTSSRYLLNRFNSRCGFRLIHGDVSVDSINPRADLKYLCLPHDRLRLLADLARNFIRIALLKFRQEQLHGQRPRITLIREFAQDL